MKKCFLFLFIIISFTVFAQKINSETERKLYVGVNFTPEIGYRNLISKYEPSWNNYSLKYRDKAETPGFSYTAGLKVQYNLAKWFSLETGILYSNKSYNGKYQFDIISLADSSIEGLSDFYYNYHFHFIEIPLKSDFRFHRGKTTFFVSVGVSIDVFITETGKEYIELYNIKSKFKDNDGYKLVNVYLNGGLGVQREINSHFVLQVAPVFKYSITAGNLLAIDSKEFLYSGGINVVLYYKL